MNEKVDSSQTNPVNTSPAEQVPPTSSTPKLPIIVGGVVLLFIGVAIGWYFSRTSEREITTQTTVSPSPQVERNSEMSEEYIELYNMSLMLPQGWSIEEINRRPEPTGIGIPVTGHDCADYQITNSDRTLELSLKPSCGNSDGGAEELPSPYKTVREYSNGDIIARYFDTTENKYKYTNVGYATISDESGTRETLMANGIVGVGPGEEHTINVTILSVDAVYSGNEENAEAQLQLADQVVASLDISNKQDNGIMNTGKKTYSNEIYMFEYYEGWSYVEEGGESNTVQIYDHGSEIPYGPDQVISIFETDYIGQISFQDPVGKQVESGENIYITKLDNVMVDGISAMRLEREVGEDARTDTSSGLVTIIPYNDKYIQINLYSDSINTTPAELEGAYEELIDSFQFIE